MVCPNCGRELPYGATYCLFCNIPVDSTDPPASSEPTRVMRPVTDETGPDGEPPEPPVKPPKKGDDGREGKKVDKKKVLFYGSITAIAVAMLLIIFIIVRSIISMSGDSTGQRSFPTGNHASYNGQFSEPEFATPSRIPSSEPQSSSSKSSSSSEPSSSDSSDDSSAVSSRPKPVVNPADTYFGTRYSVLEDTFGEPTKSGNMFTFPDCPYQFGFGSSSPSVGDTVKTIRVNSGRVNSSITIGTTTYSQIMNAKKENYDWNDSEFWIILNAGSYKIMVYFSKTDRTFDGVAESEKSQKAKYAVISAD